MAHSFSFLLLLVNTFENLSTISSAHETIIFCIRQIQVLLHIIYVQKQRSSIVSYQLSSAILYCAENWQDAIEKISVVSVRCTGMKLWMTNVRYCMEWKDTTHFLFFFFYERIVLQQPYGLWRMPMWRLGYFPLKDQPGSTFSAMVTIWCTLWLTHFDGRDCRARGQNICISIFQKAGIYWAAIVVVWSSIESIFILLLCFANSSEMTK